MNSIMKGVDGVSLNTLLGLGLIWAKIGLNQIRSPFFIETHSQYFHSYPKILFHLSNQKLHSILKSEFLRSKLAKLNILTQKLHFSGSNDNFDSILPILSTFV